MMLETDAAFRSIIEAIDFSPYNPLITGFVPDSRAVPFNSVDYVRPSIGISHISMKENLRLFRSGEKMIISYSDDDVAIVDYPTPWIIGYQLDLRSSNRHDEAQFEMNKMIESILRRPPAGLYPGRDIDVTWELNGYLVSGYASCSMSAMPQILNDLEDDGRLRTTFRFDVSTWLFSNADIEIVGRIKYRMLELADSSFKVYRTENPDGYVP